MDTFELALDPKGPIAASAKTAIQQPPDASYPR